MMKWSLFGRDKKKPGDPVAEVGSRGTRAIKGKDTEPADPDPAQSAEVDPIEAARAARRAARARLEQPAPPTEPHATPPAGPPPGAEAADHPAAPAGRPEVTPPEARVYDHAPPPNPQLPTTAPVGAFSLEATAEFDDPEEEAPGEFAAEVIEEAPAWPESPAAPAPRGADAAEGAASEALALRRETTGSHQVQRRPAAPAATIDAPTEAIVRRGEEGVLPAQPENLPHHLPRIERRVITADLDRSLAPVFGGAFAREHHLLPFMITPDGTLWVVCPHPVVRKVDNTVQAYARDARKTLPTHPEVQRVRYALADPEIIDLFIGRMYPEQGTPQHALERIDIASLVGPAPEDTDTLVVDEKEASGMKALLKLILLEAVNQGASDVDITPTETELVIRNQVDKEFTQAFHNIPRHAGPQLVSVIKQCDPDRLKTLETKIFQSGGFKAKVPYRGVPRLVEVRVEITPTIFGESVVMRIQDRGARILKLESFCRTQRDLDALRGLMRVRDGILLVVAPVASGKTSLLHSFLSEIDLVKDQVIGIEDPVEIRTPRLKQIQIDEQNGVTFESVLKTFLRQAPHRLLVGEIRTPEAAELALSIAFSGHQVLTTMHADDAPRGLVRLLRMGLEPEALKSTLRVVVAQRLVPKICEDCWEYVPAGTYSDTALANDGFSPEEIRMVRELEAEGKGLKYGKGCQACLGRGVKGLIAIQEMMTIDDEIKRILVENPPSIETDLRVAGIRGGMRPLRRLGVDLALHGIASVEHMAASTASLSAGDLREVFQLEREVGLETAFVELGGVYGALPGVEQRRLPAAAPERVEAGEPTSASGPAPETGVMDESKVGARESALADAEAMAAKAWEAHKERSGEGSDSGRPENPTVTGAYAFDPQMLAAFRKSFRETVAKAPAEAAEPVDVDVRPAPGEAGAASTPLPVADPAPDAPEQAHAGGPDDFESGGVDLDLFADVADAAELLEADSPDPRPAEDDGYDPFALDEELAASPEEIFAGEEGVEDDPFALGTPDTGETVKPGSGATASGGKPSL